MAGRGDIKDTGEILILFKVINRLVKVITFNKQKWITLNREV